MSARSRRLPWWGPRRSPVPELAPEPAERLAVNLPVYEDPWTGFRGHYAGELLGHPVFHVETPSPLRNEDEDD